MAEDMEKLIDELQNKVVRRFLCNFCPQSFKAILTKMYHEKSKHPEKFKVPSTEKTFQCEDEGKSQAINEHKKLQSTSYSCTFTGCKKKFKSQQTYKQHMGIHKAKKIPRTFPEIYHPPLTRKKYIQMKKKTRMEKADQDNMAEDVEKLIDVLPKKKPVIKVANPSFSCNFCPQSFKAIRTKKYHERSKHPEEFKDSPNLLQFFCEECGYEFKRVWNLKKHKESVHNTERTFKCDEEGCEKLFKTNQARNEHQKLHSTLFTCTFTDCTKTFKSQQTYRQHMGMHMGNQFPCTFPGCDHPPFTRKKALNAHKNSKHKYIVKYYNCTECDKFYSSKNKLNAHMKYHLEKKFFCDICGKSHHEKHRLKRHIIKHAGLRAWKCHLCVEGIQKDYFFRDGLKKHLKKFHDNAIIIIKLNYKP